MNRAQYTFITFGLVLASLAVLFPYWDELRYWEEIPYASTSYPSPSGSSSVARGVGSSRFFLFTGPKKPRPSQPNAKITRFSPKLQVAQLITEVSFITALTAFLVWMLRTSPRVTESRRQGGMFLVQAALVLYIVSLPLPAINYGAEPMMGWQAVLLSFIGVRFIFNSGDFQHERGAAPACLIGALANVLFVSAYVALLARRYLPITRPTYKACSFMACLATAGTVGVLTPLTFGAEEFSVSIGYVLWVGAATALAFAARRLSSAEVAP